MHDLTPKPLEKIPGHSLLIVRLIAVGKLLKAASLLIIGIILFHMVNLDRSVHDSLKEFINAVRLDPNNHFIHEFLEKTLGLSRTTLRVFSVGTFIYSALFTLEGLGLLFDKAWAEWMVIITTAGFIPLEIYEMYANLTILKALIFALNLLILIYIAMRLRWRHLAKLQARAKGFPLITHHTTPSGIKP